MGVDYWILQSVVVLESTRFRLDKRLLRPSSEHKTVLKQSIGPTSKTKVYCCFGRRETPSLCVFVPLVSVVPQTSSSSVGRSSSPLLHHHRFLALCLWCRGRGPLPRFAPTETSRSNQTQTPNPRIDDRQPRQRRVPPLPAFLPPPWGVLVRAVVCNRHRSYLVSARVGRGTDGRTDERTHGRPHTHTLFLFNLVWRETLCTAGVRASASSSSKMFFESGI